MTEYVGHENPKYSAPSGMTCYQIVAAYGMNFWEGNALKYLIRWQNKNGREDLLKARSYIDELIRMDEAGRTVGRATYPADLTPLDTSPKVSGEYAPEPLPDCVLPVTPGYQVSPGYAGEIPGQLPLF